MLAVGDVTDVGAIWRAAVDRYTDITQVDLSLVEPVNNVEDVLNEINKREELFKRARHDGSKTDKFRGLVSRSLKSIDKVSEVVAQGLSNTANSVSADFDKIAAFFTNVEMYLERLKLVEGKLPLESGLERALVEVLKCVLVLCGICAKHIKKGRLVKGLHTLVSGEDAELASAYSDFRKAVEHEQSIIRTLTFVRVGETNLSLEQSKGIYKQLEAREELQQRMNVLDHLSTRTFLYTQIDKFAKGRIGTCKWVLHSEIFQQWFKGAENSILWCYGDPGTGKTILSSIVIEYLSESIRASRAALVFIYCNYKETETHSELELLSSIARQLAEQLDHIPSVDECPENNRDNFFRLMKDLDADIRFMFTSRPHIDLPVEFAKLERIHISATTADLEVYLKSEILGNYRFQKRVIRNDPSIQVEIVERIIAKSAGMFLLANLHVTELCRYTDVRNVQDAMDKLPDSIFGYYDAIIERLEEQDDPDCDLAREALSIISHAKRPLSVDELVHALGVREDDTEFIESGCVVPEILLSVSAGLIKIDKQENTIRLVHQTLHEYFERFPGRLLPDSHSKLAKICLTYLSFDAFASGPCTCNKTLEERLTRHKFFRYASHHWGQHVQSSHEDHAGLILQHFRDKQKLMSCVQAMYVSLQQTKNWFDCYPKRVELLHLTAYWGLTRMSSLQLATQIGVDVLNSRAETPLLIAAQRDHTEVVELFLHSGADINAQSSRGETALYWAAKNGNRALAQLLLLHHAEILADLEGWTAINWVVVRGDIELLRLLLERYPDSTVGMDSKRQAFYLAAEEGRHEILQMLLYNGVPINMRDKNGSTALDNAIAAGQEATAQMLLLNDANVNSIDEYGNTALHWSVPNTLILRSLLQRGAVIDARTETGETALFWAAQGGSVASAELLLDKGADFTTTDSNGTTPLHRAALQGHEEILKMLLQKGASPTVRDKDGWTPLYGAAVKKHDKVVQLLLREFPDQEPILDLVNKIMEGKKRDILLQKAEEKGQGTTAVTGLRFAAQEADLGKLRMILERGADVDGKDPLGCTALELAAFHGHLEIAEVLLDYGASVNIRGSLNRPPLYHAVEQSNDRLVQLLIEHGADVEMDVFGVTSLMLAAELDYPEIIKILLDAKADSNRQNCYGHTALHLAASNGLKHTTRLLIEGGALLNISNDQGKTPLILAVENTQKKVVSLLLSYGSDTEVRTDEGLTALHVAVFMKSPSITRLLLEGRANINAYFNGLTALEIASLMGHDSLQRLLLKKGATPGPRTLSSEAGRDRAIRSVDQQKKVLLVERFHKMFVDRGVANSK
ncbi:hypothetical protein PITC_085840 [Penicillium italicum]|uniref:Uncharacterized protein n=1 Tax=Penicillium italicum TaxID=40296 RepID=A0A0A2L9J6_PENIT|nr:hypothetical protein PITC_085840 [Penicillium italicum]